MHQSVDLSFVSLFLNADIVVKLVILLLVAASFASWKVIFEKFVFFKQIIILTDKFEKYFWSSESSMEEIFARVKSKGKHPAASIFVSAMEEMRAMGSTNIGPDAIKDIVYCAMKNNKSREMLKLTEGLGTLAKIGTAAPFVGLFGTVWGIMDSFRSIAAMKNVTLAVVAPGISEALFATAIGFIVAIPAYVAYNYFADKSDIIDTRLDNFADDLMLVLAKQIYKR